MNRFNSDRARRLLRSATKWLVLGALAALAIYRLAFAPTPVVTHTVSKAPIVAEVMGTGTLEARVKTAISPRIQERLDEVLVDQGDAVRRGQLLARLDDGELGRQVEVANAELESARATLGRVRADEASAARPSSWSRTTTGPWTFLTANWKWKTGN